MSCFQVTVMLQRWESKTLDHVVMKLHFVWRFYIRNLLTRPWDNEKMVSSRKLSFLWWKPPTFLLAPHKIHHAASVQRKFFTFLHRLPRFKWQSLNSGGCHDSHVISQWTQESRMLCLLVRVMLKRWESKTLDHVIIQLHFVWRFKWHDSYVIP